MLHEFPLEAGVDPGFDLADETETPRFIEASLDRALRIGRGLSLDDPDVALLFTELGEPRIAERTDGAARSPAGGGRRAQSLSARPRHERRDGVRAAAHSTRCAALSPRLPAATQGFSPAFAAIAAPCVAGFALLALEIAASLTEVRPADCRRRSCAARSIDWPIWC